MKQNRFNGHMNSETNENPSSITLTNETFEQDVVLGSQEHVVIVFFWGPWCGLCRQLIPQVESLVRKTNGRAVLALADVREMRGIGNRLGMRGLPSLFAFRQGQHVDSILGTRPVEFFETWLNQLVAGEDMHRDE